MAHLLLVCTGNICRSPMAEGFLREALRRRLGDQSPEVSSAGIIAGDGDPAHPDAVWAAALNGTDISDHRTRSVRPAEVRGADVVVTMTGEQRDFVRGLAPDASGRTFTLKELVRLLEQMPSGSPAGPEARVGGAEALRASGFPGNPRDEDVPDPLGMSRRVFEAVAWEVRGWCERLADGLVGTGATLGVGGEE